MILDPPHAMGHPQRASLPVQSRPVEPQHLTAAHPVRESQHDRRLKPVPGRRVQEVPRLVNSECPALLGPDAPALVIFIAAQAFGLTTVTRMPIP